MLPFDECLIFYFHWIMLQSFAYFQLNVFFKGIWILIQTFCVHSFKKSVQHLETGLLVQLMLCIRKMFSKWYLFGMSWLWCLFQRKEEICVWGRWWKNQGSCVTAHSSLLGSISKCQGTQPIHTRCRLVCYV